jgi:DNA polymerase-3 subunit alpha
MRPDNIRDLIACNALYRPGPLGGGMVDAYVNRKQGKEKPVYTHPLLEGILGETYGVMVYQEQVMRILNLLGGIELSSAYACIKAISKKKQDVIDARRAEFIQGAKERGVPEGTAREIFELILFFGGYGFNKSHSAAYALLGYQTAYLKAHYTAEFMAALLSSEIEDGNKRDSLVQHIEDARRLGVEVLPPDINAGEVAFTVAKDKILFGLTAIKGVGRGAGEEIVRCRRERGLYKDLFDFCERVDLKLVPRSAIERLIKAGAFDSFGARRSQWMYVLPKALQAAGELQQDRRAGQRNFLDLAAGSSSEPSQISAALPDIPEWPSNEKLKNEKEALDFYFSSHPLTQHEADLARLATHRVEQLANLESNQEVILGGMLTEVRFRNTKGSRSGNTRYVTCKLEDFTGAARCVMWPDDFVRYKDEFREDRVCLVKGTIERTREEPGLVLSRVFSIEQAKQELTKWLRLSLSLEVHGPDTINRVASVLERSPGSCPVVLEVRDDTGKRCRLKTGEGLRVNPTTLSVGELEMILGPGRVEFYGQANGNGRNGR